MADAAVVADALRTRARALDRYLRRMEDLFAGKQLLLRDVERAYGGGLLEFHAYLERSLETLFVGLLRKRLAHPSKRVRTLVEIQSDIVARSVIAGDRSYADWLPFKRLTLRRADAFFASGRPFSHLEKTDYGAFDALSAIRNVLAHQSSASLRQFRVQFITGKAVLPAQHTPLKYLRGQHTIGQTRMNFLLSSAVASMDKLCK